MLATARARRFSISMTTRPLFLALLVLSLVPAGGGHAGDLQWRAPSMVRSVDAADRLVLADESVVRLAGVRVPGAVRARARRVVDELVGGRSVRLGLEAAPYDRYGRLVAHVERTDDLWLQGALLERGLAQVGTRPGEDARAGDMLELERQARSRRRGLWADPDFAPRAADEAARFIGSFQIVTGRALRSERVGDYVYVNFGEDWRSDFTLRFRRADVTERLAPAGLEPDELAGRRVEVRGLLLEAGGPLIEVSHPGQIEVVP